jgi:hypothetical protein
VLRSLFDARILTVAHLAEIHFAGSNEAARKRMMKLKADGWVTERPRERVFDPSILHLTRKGFSHLKQHGHLDDFPALGWETMEKRVQVSPLTLRHELSVGDVQAAFYRSARAETRLRIAEFRTWPRLFSFTTTRTFPGGYTKPVTIRPDGFIKICRDEGAFGETEFYFYLEVDRSTETVGNIVRRLQGYANHYRTGGFAVAHGGTVDRPDLYPFRVLLICRTEARCRSIANAATETRPAIRNSAWFTTLDTVTASGAHQRVWRTASDFGVEESFPRPLVGDVAPDPLLHPVPDTAVPVDAPIDPSLPATAE